MRAALVAALVVVAALAIASSASAQKAAAASDKVLVYVDDISAPDPKLKQEAAALTSALCGALSKDKRLDIMCAPDVKQILAFAAASETIGAQSPAIENITKRLEAVKFVVGGSLAPRANDVVLTVAGGPKSSSSEASALFAEELLVKVEEVSPAQKPKLLEKLPDVAARVVKGLLAPKPAAPPPPAPLK